MNWKEKLEEELNHRKMDNCPELYFNLLQKEIRPAFKSIESELRKYQIEVIDKGEEVRVRYAFSMVCYSLKVELVDCKIKFSAFYWDISNPSFEPGTDLELINGFNRVIELKEINQELIGELFFESFKPMIKFFKPKAT